MSEHLPYCPSLFHYERFQTREVKIGELLMGGNNPIRVQSMTTTDTMDTAATVAQSVRMIEAGCELVRITAPSLNEAKNLDNIKNALRGMGFRTPLVADIHFTPNAAELAARIVEKVRINPGNYADKKKFEHTDYTDAAYQAELERIRERFVPLVKICKEYGTAMRIGTNHGSLSDRILSRYGDTPMGMVESAMEFLRICEELNYHQIVLSMKASNPKVMVEAYRLLVHTMMKAGMNYPLHLGVTEAGDGEDGRIKSAAGIGSLLEDGLGDTIRVSLTEDPEFEIPVAKALAERYTTRKTAPVLVQEKIVLPNPFEYKRRKSDAVVNFGGEQVPRVIVSMNRRGKLQSASFFGLDYRYSSETDKWNMGEMACDFIYAGNEVVDFEIPGTLGIIHDYETWKKQGRHERRYPLVGVDSYFDIVEKTSDLVFLQVKNTTRDLQFLSKINHHSNVILVLGTDHEHGMADQRAFFAAMEAMGNSMPVVIRRSYEINNAENLQLYASTDVAGLLLDGFGDGVWVEGEASPNMINRLCFGILQATRTRISKTEYISCPSCGRTLFDLQETTQKIRQRTQHLKGVKIGIMGCIVNGPGEMADADYGYVGVGVGKITLYKGKEVVRKNINTEEAVEALVDLIRQNGEWIEAPENI
jgi:(E)-4-hydroxy-3-methylbut-2-enyl-diphosphate synthase